MFPLRISDLQWDIPFTVIQLEMLLLIYLKRIVSNPALQSAFVSFWDSTRLSCFSNISLGQIGIFSDGCEIA